MAKSSRPAALPEEAVDAERVLAFVNTLRPTSAPLEPFDSYAALVDWARRQHLVPAASAERLLAESRRHPHHAAAVLAKARNFREALNALATAVDAGKPPSAEALATIADGVSEAYANARLVPYQDSLQWVARSEDDLARILWEVGRAAGRLLVSPRLARVRACAADDCGWWFLDDTKNRSRRWCDMKICGNREKVRRYRKKH